MNFGSDYCNGVHGSVSLLFNCTYVKYGLEVITGNGGSVLLQQQKTKAGDSIYIVTIVDYNKQKQLREDYNYGDIEMKFVAFSSSCHSRRGGDKQTRRWH